MMYAMLSQIYRQYFKGAEKADKVDQDVIKKTVTNDPPPPDKHHKDHHSDHHQTPPDQQLFSIYPVDSSSHHKELIQLQQKNSQLQDFVMQSKTRETEFQKVLGDYDELFQKLVDERKALLMKNADSTKHLENMETGFYDLLKKYEKAKEIIKSYQDNEIILKGELDRYKTLVGDVKRGVTGSNNNKEATYLVYEKTNTKELTRRK